MIAPKQTRLPRFTLRMLFIVLTLAILLIGRDTQIVRERRAMIDSLVSRGGRIAYQHPDGDGSYPRDHPMPQVSWVRAMMGDRAVYSILPPPTLTASERELLEGEIDHTFPEAIVTTH